MITALIAFLRAHWLPALISVFALGITAKLAYERFEIMRLQEKLAMCTAETAALTNERTALLRSVETQNAAVTLLQSEQEKKAAAAAQALTAARANARKYALRIRKIEANGVSGNECADLKNLVNDYVNPPAPGKDFP